MCARCLMCSSTSWPHPHLCVQVSRVCDLKASPTTDPTTCLQDVLFCDGHLEQAPHLIPDFIAEAVLKLPTCLLPDATACPWKNHGPRASRVTRKHVFHYGTQHGLHKRTGSGHNSPCCKERRLMCTHLLLPAVAVGFALAAPSGDVRNTGGPKGMT